LTVSPTLLFDLPQLVCNGIDEVLPDLERSAPFYGEFTFAELKSMGLPSPAVLVSLLRLRQAREAAGGLVEFHAGMVAYVITKNSLGAGRDQAATNIVQALHQLIPGNIWGNAACGQARDVTARPAITKETRDAGVSLWLVMWVQPITFFAEEPGPLRAELYVSQAPDIGAANEGSYDQVGDAT